MIIKEIDGETFNSFANSHLLKNHFQTKEYGELMSKHGYSSIFVGGYVEDEMVAGSLILYKTIGPSIKYGYAPRGFLIDYYDDELLKTFTKKIKDFFFKKGFAFIKINPEITYSRVDFQNKTKSINERNNELIDTLKSLGYDKLKDNLYFESLLPKFTPVIFLPNYNLDALDESLSKAVNCAQDEGLMITIGDENDVESFFSYISDKTSRTLDYYKDLYKIFSESNMIDLLLIKLDYDTNVKYLQKQYLIESEINEKVNIDFNNNPRSASLYNAKMKSDRKLANISARIKNANSKMQENNLDELLGAGIILKHKGRVTIGIYGYNKDYITCDLKAFLIYKIIEHYQRSDFLYLDLNGITGDFKDTNPYKQLNDFKLKFKPNVYEYIGEFDLIVNKPFHQILWSTNKIQKEFYKPMKKESK